MARKTGEEGYTLTSASPSFFSVNWEESVGGGWAYWRPSVDGIVELGTVLGYEVALPAHFHVEDQITFVFKGRRRFVVRGEAITLTAGQGALIPAGIAHRSLAEPSGVVCINAYVSAGRFAVAEMMQEFERTWRRSGYIHPEEFAAVIREHRGASEECAPATITIPSRGACREGVGAMATRAGMSREGFSRMFAKRHGMPPHAFWLMTRLNHARGMLRAGDDVAGVAAETGFADQSHLGRWFLRAFGISPGRYRAGLPWRSQTFQTRP